MLLKEITWVNYILWTVTVADLGGWTGWLATPQNSLKKYFLAGKIPIIIDNPITLTNSRNFT